MALKEQQQIIELQKERDELKWITEISNLKVSLFYLLI